MEAVAAADHSARKRARQDICLRFKDLSWQDQYEVYKFVSGFFFQSGPGSDQLREARDRAECVTSIQKVAAHLELEDGMTPGVQQYERTRKELGLRLSGSAIIRRWIVWREVRKAARGERVTMTVRQKEMLRVIEEQDYKDEEWLAGVREWLESRVAKKPYLTHAYSLWAIERNEQKPNKPPLANNDVISNRLALPWEKVLQVAKRDLSLVDAQEQYLAETKNENGIFVGINAIALIHGVTLSKAASITEETRFPPHVFKLSNGRAWYLDDIQAHRLGRFHPHRTVEELQDQIMTTAEVSETIGVTENQLTRAVRKKEVAGAGKLAPRPLGQLYGQYIWFRHHVDGWLEAKQSQPAQAA
jgi:hypothetical protein